MDEAQLIARMTEQVGRVPERAEVRELRPASVAEGERRLKRLLAAAGDVTGRRLDKGEWAARKQRTTVRLPENAHATAYHASGALRLATGIEPMAALFGAPAPADELTKLVTRAADALRLVEWAGDGERLEFERLWQIKAAAVDREGRATPPVLCRAVGAYRHTVNGVPVLGAASAAVKVAAGGALDAVTLQVRATTPTVLDRPATLPPEQGVRLLLARLRDLMGRSAVPYAELARPRWTRFGYLSLSKRQAQRVLAPVYLAQIDVEHEQEAQGYLLAVRATERTYLPLPTGREAPAPPVRRAELTRPTPRPVPAPPAGTPGTVAPAIPTPSGLTT
jgi:hypothetical protein